MPNKKNIDPKTVIFIEKLIFSDQVIDDFSPTSYQSIVFGTFILWICWLFFNAGSTYQMAQIEDLNPSLIMMNTILSGSMSGIFSVFIKNRMEGTYSKTYRYNIGSLCNGILIGLVAVTAACNNIEPWAALITGFLASLVYGGSSKLMRVLKIDDPIEAS